MLAFTYKILTVIFYSEHFKGKKITEKLLKIKGYTFKSTKESKASSHLAISVILLASKIVKFD